MRRSLDSLSSMRTQFMSRLRLTCVPARKSLKLAIGSLGNTRHTPSPDLFGAVDGEADQFLLQV